MLARMRESLLPVDAARRRRPPPRRARGGVRRGAAAARARSASGSSGAWCCSSRVSRRACACCSACGVVSRCAAWHTCSASPRASGSRVQVGMNAQLRKVLGSAYSAALVSFLVGTVALIGAAAGHAHRAARRATRWPRCRSGPGSAACSARSTSPFPPSWPRELGATSLLVLALAGQLADGAGDRSLRLAGAAGEPDHLGAPSRGSLAGRGSLAHHALKPTPRLRATQAHTEMTHAQVPSSVCLLAGGLLSAGIAEQAMTTSSARASSRRQARTRATATTTTTPAARCTTR